MLDHIFETALPKVDIGYGEEETWYKIGRGGFRGRVEGPEDPTQHVKKMTF